MIIIDYLKKSHYFRLLELDGSAFDKFGECSGSCLDIHHRVVGSFEPFAEEMLVEFGEFGWLERKTSSLELAELS